MVEKDAIQKQGELGVYAIYDTKSEKYDTPFFAVSDLFAKRRYMIMAEEEKSPLRIWAKDFELHKLGNSNMDSGDLVTGKKIILEGKSIVKGEMKNE